MNTHHNTQSLQGNSPIQLDDIRAELMSEFHFNTSLTEQVNHPGFELTPKSWTQPWRAYEEIRPQVQTESGS